MTDKNIKRIVISALIAALYATLTIALAPISYIIYILKNQCKIL